MGNDQKKRAGWKLISGSTKWHYFNNEERSLCRNFGALSLNGPIDGLESDLEPGHDDSPANCAKCKRRLNTIKDTAEETHE